MNQGATQTFTITASAGYQLVTPVGGTCGGTLSSSGTSYTTNSVTANCTVSATFTQALPTVTVTASVVGGHGSISPAGSIVLLAGDTQTFTLTPVKEYDLATPVGGTCGGTLTMGRSSYTYTVGPVAANCTVVASFVRIISFAPLHLVNMQGGGRQFSASPVAVRTAAQTLTVTPVVDEHGEINPDEPQEVKYNGILTFVVTPGEGYAITSVTGCGGRLAGNVYTTAPIREDCTIVVIFHQMFAI